MSEKPPTGPIEQGPHEPEVRREVVPVITPTMPEEDPTEKAEKIGALNERLHTRSEEEKVKKEPEPTKKQPTTSSKEEKKAHGHGGGSVPGVFAGFFLIFKMLWDGMKRWGEMKGSGGGGGGHAKASGGHGGGHGGGHH